MLAGVLEIGIIHKDTVEGRDENCFSLLRQI